MNLADCYIDFGIGMLLAWLVTTIIYELYIRNELKNRGKKK